MILEGIRGAFSFQRERSGCFWGGSGVGDAGDTEVANMRYADEDRIGPWAGRVTPPELDATG